MGTNRRKARKAKKHLQGTKVGYPEELIQRYVKAAWYGKGPSCYHELIDFLFKKVYGPKLKEMYP